MTKVSDNPASADRITQSFIRCLSVSEQAFMLLEFLDLLVVGGFKN
jgi:hypothetical protein